MDGGRFGPIREPEKSGKKYKINYNRLITLLMIVVIIVLGIVMVRDWKRKKQQPEPNFINAGGFEGYNILQAAVTTDAPKAVSLRPEPEKEGMLPVFYQANTEEKRVCVTVDGCGDVTKLNKLLELCETYGAKLTFFPTGEEITENPSFWAAATLGGHEIENHTDANRRLATLDEDDRNAEIFLQTQKLRAVIGEEYKPHFLRTNNLEDDSDEELHRLLAENGYLGVARWAQMTPASFSAIESGQILAYSANEAGVQALSTAMRVLSENGYEMVTMNRLFDYPENLESREDA